MKQVVVAAALCLVASSAQGAIERGTGLENPTPMVIAVVVEELGSDAVAIDLDTARVRNRVEPRLRQAGLTIDQTTDVYLYVNVNVVGRAFSIDMALKRTVFYYGPNDQLLRTYGTTWKNGGAGTHGTEGSYVVEALDRLVDEFLNEYLKANPPPPRN